MSRTVPLSRMTVPTVLSKPKLSVQVSVSPAFAASCAVADGLETTLALQIFLYG
jgi:hypothetical protein